MISIKNLSKYYQQHLVLDDLNIELKSGDIYALIGHNGAGKSTTIKHILGLEKPSSGLVEVNGINPYTEAEKARECMAYIPESLQLFSDLTAYENLRLFAEMTQRKLSKDQEKHYLNQVGLSMEQCSQKIKYFSKGMKQKLAIAIALSKEAKILILDEPNSGFDPKASYDLGLLLNELKTLGTSIFMVTHDIFCSHQVADEIGILSAGKLVKSLQPKEYSLAELQGLYFELYQQ